MFKFWISILVSITLICGVILATGQQILRTSANDPQIQLVEDVSILLSQGQPPEALNQQRKVDVKTSLATTIIVYDANKLPVGSTAALNEGTPSLPQGVFDYIDKHNFNTFTWEPEKGVRLAAAMKKYQTQDNATGYVLVARSLREVEKRIDNIQIIIGIGWLVSLIAASIPFVLSILLLRFNGKLFKSNKQNDSLDQGLKKEITQKDHSQKQRLVKDKTPEKGKVANK